MSQFLKRIIKKEKKYNSDLINAKALYLQHEKNLGILDKIYFKLSFFYADQIHKMYQWVYYNTFVGPHPSPEARKDAIEKYLSTIK